MQCEQYWPDKNSTEQYGDIKITGVAEKVWAEFTKREFRLEKVSYI